MTTNRMAMKRLFVHMYFILEWMFFSCVVSLEMTSRSSNVSYDCSWWTDVRLRWGQCAICSLDSNTVTCTINSSNTSIAFDRIELTSFSCSFLHRWNYAEHRIHPVELPTNSSISWCNLYSLFVWTSILVVILAVHVEYYPSIFDGRSPITVDVVADHMFFMVLSFVFGDCKCPDICLY
jgi:hypothetical protein